MGDKGEGLKGIMLRLNLTLEKKFKEKKGFQKSL
jgi:hypothetical protein